MRIAFDLRATQQSFRNSPLGGLGGMSRYAIELVRALAETDSTHEYVALVDPGPLPDRLRNLLDYACISTKQIGFGPPIGAYRESRPAPLVSLLEALPLSRQIGQLNVDLVHFLQQPPPYLAASRVPMVATLHDLYGYARDASQLDWLQRLHRRQLGRYRSMSAVVCVSKTSRDAAVSALDLDARRCVVIPPMLPASLVASNRRLPSAGAIPLSTRPRYMLHVGIATERKNPRALIEALSLLSGANRDIQLWCAGPYQVNPAARMRLEYLARELGVFGRLRMLGDVTDEELQELYAGALCLVFPSLDEGFGYPALEALAFGVPSVLADIPALHEAAGPFATYFDPLDSGALARAIAAVAAHPAEHRQRASGPTARAWLSKFRTASLAASMLETYGSCLPQRAIPA
jgi:glycosyltransferase involved in cell wall biosynthesis